MSSARLLATGCALAIIALTLSAEAGPRVTPMAKSSARKPTTTSRASVAAAAPAPAPPPVAAPTPAPPAVVAPAPTPAPAPAAAPASAPVLDLTPRDQPSPSASPLHHRATLTLNPLALVVGRYGANAEFVIAPHHALVASGYIQTFPKALLRLALPDLPIGEGPESRFGGELGYRLYSGSDGPTGVFIGPSFIAMPLAAPRLTDDYRAEVVSFTAFGASLDIGAQAVFGPGFTIGGGLGVMALAYSPPTSATPPQGITLPTYPTPHVLPRVLLAAGWAF